MLRACLYILITLLSIPVCFSQNVITGTIKDNAGNPVPYSTLRFYKGNSPKEITTEKIADSTGNFMVQVKDTGNYSITATCIGYEDTISHFSIASSITKVDLIMIKKNDYLSSVIVNARIPLISRKADRYILNVSQSVLTKGRNTFDILNYAPGVMTVGDAIAINGNTSTKVMVNGRLLHLSSDQLHNYLTNLSADEVQSVEIIPVPGAEYDAEGGGGIINIKLKKKHSGGLSGSVGLGAKTPEWPSYNTNEQLNYSINGFQVYASHNYNHNNSYADYSDTRASGTETYLSDSHSKRKSYSNNYRLGAGYDFKNNQFLGVEFNGNNNSSNNNTLTNSIFNNTANNQYNKINTDVTNQNKNSLYSLSLNYNWNIDSLGSTFKLMSDYTWADYHQTGNYQSQYSDSIGNFLFDSVYQNQVPLKIDNYDIGIDYNKNWERSASLKLGAKFTSTHTLNDVRYQNLENGKYENDTTRSNTFDYTEDIAAAYIQYSKDWKKTSLQLGVRGENTHSIGISTTTNTTFTKDYFNLFPSAFVKHDFSDNHTLSFSYSRRLDRPTFAILNPFELRSDDYTYVKGNPNLIPQYTHDIELAYLFDKKYELTLFTQLTQNPFGQPLNNDGGNSIVSEYLWINMKYNNNFGANLYVPVTVAKWWTMTNNFLVYHNIIAYPGGSNAKTIFQGKTTQDITIKKGWRFEASGYYQSSYNIANLVFVPNYSVDLGLYKSLLKDKLEISLLATDIFNTDRMDYKSTGSDLILSEKQKYLTRRFSLQLTYNFKKGKKVKIKKVEAGNGDEKNRM